MFTQGNRVRTPSGLGTVVFNRMAAPGYHEVEAYSVLLDKDKAESERPPFPTKFGTIFPAKDVEPLQGQEAE